MSSPLPDLGLPDPRLATGAARLALRYGETFAPQTVQALVTDSYRRLADGAAVPDHLVVLTERLATDRLDALAHNQRLPTDRVPRVLFVCTGNAGRSQLAAALLAQAAGGRVQVSSAGTAPAAGLDPYAARTLAEIEVPLPLGAFPKPLTEEIVAAADIVVTMGCGEACPVPIGRRYLDWPVPDPATASIEQVRAIRDEITERVHELLAELGTINPTTP